MGYRRHGLKYQALCLTILFFVLFTCRNIAVSQSDMPQGAPPPIHWGEKRPIPAQPSVWPTDLLLQHIMRILDELDKRYTERFLASQEAIEKAGIATQNRFESVNEFRALVESMIATLMKKDEALARDEQLSRSIDDLRLSMTAQLNALQEQFAQRLNTIEKQYSGDINSIRSRLDLNEGTRSGIASGWGILVAGILVAAAVVTVVIRLR